MGKKQKVAISITEANRQKERERFYRKDSELFPLIERIKLWPSRSGMLHGIRQLKVSGDTATIITHCGAEFSVSNSRNGRACRWIRNKWSKCACRACKIPDWKLAKFSRTAMVAQGGENL